MIDQPDFVQISGNPAAWGAAVWPWWTLVITCNSKGKYAASARDSRDVLQTKPRHNIGADFASFEAAQAACCEFVQRQVAE